MRPGGSASPWADQVRPVYEAERARLWRALVAWTSSPDEADEAIAEAFARPGTGAAPASSEPDRPAWCMITLETRTTRPLPEDRASMTDHDQTDDGLWVATDAEDPAELPLTARGADRSRRSPWLLVGGVAVLVVALVAGAWVLAGRDDDDDDVRGSGGGGGAAAGFVGQRWQVEAIEGADAPELGREPPELFLDASTDGALSFTGCNGGSGSATVEGDRLVVGADGFTSTDMACIPDRGPDLMAYDVWMSDLLASKPTVAVDGDRLTLTSDVGTVTARRASDTAPGTGTTIPAGDPDAPVSNDPADPSHLPDPGSGTAIVPGPTVAPGGDGGGSVGSEPAGTGADDAVGHDWEVAGLTVDGVERTVVPDRDGGPIVLDLTQRDLVAFTGCNGGAGTVRVEGDRLVVGGLNSTKLACTGADGEALLAQDAAIAALLEAGPTAAVEGGTLTLTGPAGTLTATRIG